MIPGTFHVDKIVTEVHALRVCPCNACTTERNRLQIDHSDPPPGAVRISPHVAHTFGLIPDDPRKGSLARQLQNADQQ